MKVRDCYISDKKFTKIKGIGIACNVNIGWRYRRKIFALIEAGTMSGTIGEKGWWIVKKEFRLNEYSL